MDSVVAPDPLSPTAVDYHVSSPKSHLYASCEISVHRLPSGKVSWQSPNASLWGCRKWGSPHIDFTRTTTRFRGWNQVVEEFSGWVSSCWDVRRVSLSRCCVSSLFAAYAEWAFTTKCFSKTSLRVRFWVRSWIISITVPVLILLGIEADLSPGWDRASRIPVHLITF